MNNTSYIQHAISLQERDIDQRRVRLPAETALSFRVACPNPLWREQWGPRLTGLGRE